MTGKEHFISILKKESGHPGFWHGHPHRDIIERLYSHYNVKTDFELGLKLPSIIRTVSPEGYTWNFFGMENCFVKMHTNPEVVEAVTSHITNFYLIANEKLFEQAKKKIDAVFIGVDMGSQLDLLLSPEGFERFLFPYLKKLINQAHDHGYYLVLHSCGSIYRIIPDLIKAGVDVLHPIQAQAKFMDAETLAKNYNGKIVFLGGVDTQYVLPFGSPHDVKEEVRRLRKLFGPNYIVSPSHETLLPSVKTENVEAMVEAAWE